MATNRLNLATSIGRRLVAHYGRPNKFITWYCDRRKLGGAWLTAPWCAMFASFVYNAAGLGKAAGEFAYCPSWVRWFKDRKQWGTTPRVGAAVFYDWDKDGQADHVGIVTKVGKTSIKSLEGNTKAKGARNWVAEVTRSRSSVLGYGYVDDEPAKRTYVVRKGDSLSKIGKIYGLTWQKLYAANRDAVGPKPTLIKPGMVLVIP